MKSIYFRLNYPAHLATEKLIASRGLADMAPELGSMLRPGHVVLAARYAAESAAGQVRAIGLVIANGARLEIDWQPCSFDLHPSQQGQMQWKKEHFCFDRLVAERYGLHERVRCVFGESPAPAPGRPAPARPCAERDPTTPTSSGRNTASRSEKPSTCTTVRGCSM